MGTKKAIRISTEELACRVVRSWGQLDAATHSVYGGERRVGIVVEDAADFSVVLWLGPEAEVEILVAVVFGELGTALHVKGEGVFLFFARRWWGAALGM